MANYGLDKGYIVNTGQTVTKGVACIVSGANNTVSTAGANAIVLGIYQETLDAAKVATGKATVGVRLTGVAHCVAGAGVTRNTRVKTDSNGKITPFVGTAGTVENCVGIVLETGSTGDIVEVLLTPGASVNTAVS
jgi:hypothetical protein